MRPPVKFIIVDGFYNEATTIFAPSALKCTLKIIRNALAQNLVCKFEGRGRYDVSDLFVPLPEASIECDIYDKLRDDEMWRNGTGYGDDLNRIGIQFAGLPPFPTCRDKIQALLVRGTHCVTLDPPKSMRGTLSKCDGYAREFVDRDSAVFEDRTLVICSDASAWPPIANLILNIALLCPKFEVVDEKTHTATSSIVKACKQLAAEYEYFATCPKPEFSTHMIRQGQGTFGERGNCTFNFEGTVICKDVSDYRDYKSLMLLDSIVDLPTLRLGRRYTCMHDLSVIQHAVEVTSGRLTLRTTLPPQHFVCKSTALPRCDLCSINASKAHISKKTEGSVFYCDQCLHMFQYNFVGHLRGPTPGRRT